MPRCISDLCLLLGYSRQSYYQGKKHKQQKAYQADFVIAEVLRYRKHQKRLGTRKLYGEMRLFLMSHKIKMGRDGLFTILREHGLLVRKRKRRGSVTTFSKHRYKKYPHIVKDFIPIAPNQLWVSDITYIHIKDKFAYLSLITDAYSRKIVGFFLNRDLSAHGSLMALKMALRNNHDRDDLIHHSDRGVQYCCDDYVRLLQRNGIKISMTENGDPLENALAERVNGILKTELLDNAFPNFNTAKHKVAVACSTYNHLRPHGSIDNLKPVEAHQRSGKLPKRWKNYYQINKQKKEVKMVE